MLVIGLYKDIYANVIANKAVGSEKVPQFTKTYVGYKEFEASIEDGYVQDFLFLSTAMKHDNDNTGL